MAPMAQCDPAEQQERQDFLDTLYHQAGRDRKDHPAYGTYTGLYQEWAQAPTASAAPVVDVAEAFDAWWKESYPMAPANAQARASHIAFGEHLIQRGGSHA